MRCAISSHGIIGPYFMEEEVCHLKSWYYRAVFHGGWGVSSQVMPGIIGPYFMEADDGSRCDVNSQVIDRFRGDLDLFCQLNHVSWRPMVSAGWRSLSHWSWKSWISPAVVWWELDITFFCFSVSTKITRFTPRRGSGGGGGKGALALHFWGKNKGAKNHTHRKTNDQNRTTTKQDAG